MTTRMGDEVLTNWTTEAGYVLTDHQYDAVMVSLTPNFIRSDNHFLNIKLRKLSSVSLFHALNSQANGSFCYDEVEEDLTLDLEHKCDEQDVGVLSAWSSGNIKRNRGWIGQVALMEGVIICPKGVSQGSRLAPCLHMFMRWKLQF